jgi:hypothetical protein
MLWTGQLRGFFLRSQRSRMQSPSHTTSRRRSPSPPSTVQRLRHRVPIWYRLPLGCLPIQRRLFFRSTIRPLPINQPPTLRRPLPHPKLFLPSIWKRAVPHSKRKRYLPHPLSQRIRDPSLRYLPLRRSISTALWHRCSYSHGRLPHRRSAHHGCTCAEQQRHVWRG